MIIMASDHRGYPLKEELKTFFNQENIITIDVGTYSKEPVDYPDFAFILGENVVKKRVDFGVAMCGSGAGMTIACNKVKGIRCAKADSVRDAKYSRLDNDANILALSGRMPKYKALDILDTFISTEHKEVERHDRRIKKITDYEEEHYK